VSWRRRSLRCRWSHGDNCEGLKKDFFTSESCTFILLLDNELLKFVGFPSGPFRRTDVAQRKEVESRITGPEVAGFVGLKTLRICYDGERQQFAPTKDRSGYNSLLVPSTRSVERSKCRRCQTEVYDFRCSRETANVTPTPNRAAKSTRRGSNARPHVTTRQMMSTPISHQKFHFRKTNPIHHRSLVTVLRRLKMTTLVPGFSTTTKGPASRRKLERIAWSHTFNSWH